MLAVFQTVLQSGGGSEYLLEFAGILGTRQLHHDPSLALLLDDGFGNTQCIHPVAQGGDILIQGESLDLLLLLPAHSGCHQKVPSLVGGIHQKIAELISYDLQCLIPHRGILELDRYPFTIL